MTIAAVIAELNRIGDRADLIGFLALAYELIERMYCQRSSYSPARLAKAGPRGAIRFRPRPRCRTRISIFPSFCAARQRPPRLDFRQTKNARREGPGTLLIEEGEP
jgi:hypothetical protein